MRSAALYVFLMCILSFGFAYAKSSTITYTLNSKEKWKRDVTTEPFEDGNERFTLAGDDTIDLLFTFDNADHFNMIKAEGFNLFFQKVMKGKNLIHGMISDEDIQDSNLKTADQGDRKVVSFETKYKYGEVKYSSIERYYIYENQAFQAILRWNEKSDLKKVKALQADFDALVVKQVKDNK
jgi:hypothetical protein